MLFKHVKNVSQKAIFYATLFSLVIICEFAAPSFPQTAVRSATVLAKNNLVLLRLNLDDYNRILRPFHTQLYSRRRDFLSQQALLRALPAHRILQLTYQCVQVWLVRRNNL
jgi:hypothetical protein